VIISKEWVAGKLPKRPKDANKGTFGKVLVVAGSKNYPGAAYLSCAGCYRVGAGLVTLATIPVVQNIVSKKLPEVTFIVLPEEDGVIGEMALDVLFAKISHDVILIGPGLNKKEGTAKFIYRMLKMGIGDLTFVIDGDGLNSLSAVDKWWIGWGSEAVLTPHPGEMAQLTGLSVKQIQSSREKVAQEFSKKWNKARKRW